MPVASTSDGLWGWGRPYQDPELDIPGMQLQINPAYKGRTTWDTGLDGPLILEPNGKVISYTVTSLTTGNLTFQLWGAGGGAGGQDSSVRGGNGSAGGYVEATVAVPVAKTAFTVGTGTGGNVGGSNYTGQLTRESGLPGAPGGHPGSDPGVVGASGGGGGGGGYSSVTIGTKWILVAAGGGGGGGGGNSFADNYAGFHLKALAAHGQSTATLGGGSFAIIKPVPYYKEFWTADTKMNKPWDVDSNVSVRTNDGGGHGGGGGGWFQGWTANNYASLPYDNSGFGGNVGANFANIANVSLIKPATVTSIESSPLTAEQLQWGISPPNSMLTSTNNTVLNGIQFEVHDRSLPYGFWDPMLANISNQDFYVGRGGDSNEAVSFWANASANIGAGGNGRVVVSSTYPFFDADGQAPATGIAANVSIKTLEGVKTVFYGPTGTTDVNACVIIKSIGYDSYGNLAYDTNANIGWTSVAYPIRVQNLESTVNLTIGAPGSFTSNIIGFTKEKCYSYRFPGKNLNRVDGTADRSVAHLGQAGGVLVYDTDGDDLNHTYLRKWWESSRTIEMWTKIETPTQSYDQGFPNQVSYTNRWDSTDQDYTSFAFGFNSANKLAFYAGSLTSPAGADSNLATGVAGRRTVGTTAVTTGEWAHIALTWDLPTRTITGFLNGKIEFRVRLRPEVTWNVWSQNYYNYSRFVIGQAGYRDRNEIRKNFEGWISNFRLSKTVRYTDAFTPPAAVFTLDSDTAILACHRPDVYSEGTIPLQRAGSLFVTGDTPFNETVAKTHNLVASGPLIFDRPGTYTFTATESINVPIKMWGGSGGVAWETLGGAGGYTHGIVKLEKGTTYKVIVGEAGSGQTSPNIFTGTDRNVTAQPLYYDADGYTRDARYSAGSGGGGTAILKISGATETPILVAGGGGGSAYFKTNYTSIEYRYYGGAGGGDRGQGTAANTIGDLSTDLRSGGIGGDYRGILQQGITGWPDGGNARWIRPDGNNGGPGFDRCVFGGGRGYGYGGAGGWGYSNSAYNYLGGGGGGGGYGGGSGGYYDYQYVYTSDQRGPYSTSGGGGGGGYVNPSYVTPLANTFTGVNYFPANAWDPVRLRVDGEYSYYCGGGPATAATTCLFGAHPGLVVIYA